LIIVSILWKCQTPETLLSLSTVRAEKSTDYRCMINFMYI
jgi:hypothetical protein